MSNSIHYEALPLEVDMFGTPSTIFPVLIWDADGATLVDAGYPGLFTALIHSVEQRIGSFEKIKRVIITHHDWDHIGTLPDIARAYQDKITILAHHQEKPYIEGTLPNLKLTPERIKERLCAMPKEYQAKASAVFSHLPASPVHSTVADGEILPCHGGLQVIHTPGHTPGHICLYLKSHRLLIAGDQLRVLSGVLVGPAPEYTPDRSTALASLQKLTHFDIDCVACYHGGIYCSNPLASIQELALYGVN